MSKGTILVTGGCGYIGSHTIVDLLENGYSVVSADDLSNADERVLDGIKAITGIRVVNHQLDLADRDATRKLFAAYRFDGAIHFAAAKLVGESVQKPLHYYRNNLNSLMNVLECLDGQGNNGKLIFSSSCSVYGNARELPVTENTPRQAAESPYAATKQMGEDILQDYCRAHPHFGVVALRYFNPAGAHPSGLIGESPANPPSSLVPVITETAHGKREEVVVFGNDYPTRDGSAVRDYIHVSDLAHAHTLALHYAQDGRAAANYELFNLGIGAGLTVLEVIHAFEEVAGVSLNYRIGPRRAGDVVAIYADNTRAEEVLGWQPRHDVRDIMRTAWAWEQKRSA
ncbi:MAG: UDP-glucose 4-epimerase GalE [Saprospiraceae bacterium]